MTEWQVCASLQQYLCVFMLFDGGTQRHVYAIVFKVIAIQRLLVENNLPGGIVE